MLTNLIRHRGKTLLDRLKVADMQESIGSLERWVEQDFGRYLVQQEQQVLERKYAQLPGYRLMHLGLAPSQAMLDSFKQLHSFYMGPSPASLTGSSAVTNYAELPLPTGTIDVALLQHGVEYSLSPKAVLAEVSRVVAPGGHLLLCLFNPYGPIGALKFPMQLLMGRSEYRFHNLRKGRVVDWLSLLNFQVLEIDHGAYNLPLNRPGWLESDSLWEQLCQKIRFPLGNFYMIHAVKRELRSISNKPTLWQPAANNGYGGPSRKTSSKNVSNKARKN
ncbi:class I SAM-dependent methyltransferase [Porticoccaceae bacterium]|nr:class I SAM-dependent methyltransferase [Porticoccaceae bacterium]